MGTLRVYIIRFEVEVVSHSKWKGYIFVHLFAIKHVYEPLLKTWEAKYSEAEARWDVLADVFSYVGVV